MTTYTGDILIKQISDGSYDFEFSNGQPAMTGGGLETLCLLAVFGEDWWGNDLFHKKSEQMNSKFPDVIRRAVASDKTKNDGVKAIETALEFLKKEKIASKVTVEAEIINAYSIGWLIQITRITDETSRFFINWDNGALTAKFVEWA